MLAHLLSSGVRSLAITVVLGCILIYATGGLGSPIARGMVGVIAICFFLFWITFFFMFGPRVPKHAIGRDDGDGDGVSHIAFRRRRCETDGNESETSDTEHSAGSD